MAKAIKPEDIGKAIKDELAIYHESVTERIDKLSEEAAKALVKKTKDTAPKRTGSFRKNITSKVVKESPNGNTYAWYVKPPDHRLTHLLVHGHEKVNGGRVKGDPFLEKAVNDVLPKYERDVEEAVKDAK